MVLIRAYATKVFAIVGVSSQEAAKVLLSHTNGDRSDNPRFLKAPVLFGQECIDLATCFDLSCTVIKHQLNDKTKKSK